MARQLLAGQGLLIVEAARSQSDLPSSVWLLWASDQPKAEILHDNTRYSQERDIQASGGIRTSNISKRAATNRSTTANTQQYYITML